MFEKITFDIEANNLLNKESIDYTASPYKLKDCFTMHCIVVEDIETGNLLAFHDGDKYVFDGRVYEEKDIDNGYTYILKDYKPLDYIHKPLKDFESFTKSGNIKCVVGHNILNFDLLACKLYYDFDYTVEKDTLNGFDVEYIDTLVLSKCLNPDRIGGHSLDKLSEKTGLRKINFRPYVKIEDRFKKFSADMLYYCIRDVQANTKVLQMLEKEKGSWDWDDAISLEKSIADIITRQEHRGFNFNTELAEHCIKDLDEKLEERRLRVSPIIPDKPATKAYMKDFTPPVRQFLKTGEPSSYLIKFAEKLEAEITGEVGSYKFIFKGKTYDLPLPLEPLVTTQEADINDTTHIKEWLVSEFGWNPSEYKEKDLSVKQVKGIGKVKRTPEEVTEAIDKYVEQTLNSAFCRDRCDFLEVTPEKLKHKLQSYKEGRSIKVWTNPSFTKGQEKEICPDLERIASDFPYAKDIVEYLTYKHRRNSILGGGLDWDDEEEAEKGFLAYVREDCRIPTPADTCGAATSRFRHSIVCNVPRNTSLYGEEMRGLFGVDSNKFYQLGYDFDSLEARIEAHYCYPYDKTKEYCDSLLQAKPNDVHSVMARKISNTIKRKFERRPAKSVKYACLPVDNSEVLTKQGWKFRQELTVGDDVLSYSVDKCHYEWKPIQALWDYKDADVITLKNKWFSMESTADHRWYGIKRRQKGHGSSSIRFYDKCFFTTEDINTETSIMNAAYYWNESSRISSKQAALVAWLLSDGYYKWSEPSDTTSSRKGKSKGIVGSIGQSSKKYWRELEGILADNNISYVKDTSEENGCNFYTYRLKAKDLRSFMDNVVNSRKQKHDVDWVKWVLTLDQPALQEFLYNFWLADGHSKRGNKCITQNIGNIADAVMLAGNLTGHRVTFNHKTDKCIEINLSKKAFTTGQRLIKNFSRKTDVFCLTNENETFVTRQNGIITLTGNCTYGATAPKVAKTIGETLQVGTMVFNAFWEAALPLKKLKDRLQKYWEDVGKKKFILGIDGRKVPTRSQHAILNSLFQSAGVICAKRAMVFHDKFIKEAGYSVDFFRDNWKEKTFISQLIAYHK
jgi:hypothetical protein